MTQKRILIVDDELPVRRALTECLTGRGYETVTADNNVEGLAQAMTGQFHTVLLGLHAPDVGGLEIIDALYAEQPALPLVIISEADALSEAIGALQRGAWDYITKPIQGQQVAAVVEQVLERAHLLAERDQHQWQIEQLSRSIEAEVARQTQELQAQNRGLMALSYISYAISASLDLGALLNRTLNVAVSAVEADGGMMWLLNPATGKLVVAAINGLPQAFLTSAQAIPLGQGLAGEVAQSGHPRTEHDLQADPWLAPLAQPRLFPSEGYEGFRSCLCVPLRAGSGAYEEYPTASRSIVGVLGITMRAEREFAAHEIDLLGALSNQIGVAVTRAQYAAELKQANLQLERANAELRRLDTLREQFIQNAAHELRTPLALVHGYVGMLAQEGDLNPEEQRQALDVIYRNVHVLVNLVEAITTLQDLGSLPLHRERISLAGLLQTACQMAAQRATKVGIKLRNVCPLNLPPLPGDFTRLAQALYQLLDNACKFSPQGSTVTIAAQTAPAGDAVYIAVNDQGIGIPAKEHDRIFERFYQVDGSTTRQFGGTGLGLALVKEIVEAHGGTVAVQSTVGEGSTFTVILPLGPPC